MPTLTAQIEPEALSRILNRNDVRIIDGSWALDGSDMREPFNAEHIPGAQFFDLEAISDHSTDLPHMAPDPEQFAEAVSDMGIAAEDTVIVYDREGLRSAARVWWTFKLMGHEKVYVLRGGLPAWISAGFPVTDQAKAPEPNTYFPEFQAQMLIDMPHLKAVLGKPGHVVLDARSLERFNGTAPEPRPGLRSGHMPGSLSLPFGDLIRDGALKPKDELALIFKSLPLTAETDIITSCGSGVTAAIITLALYELGRTDTRLYDGSWAQWGLIDADTQVAKAS